MIHVKRMFYNKLLTPLVLGEIGTCCKVALTWPSLVTNSIISPMRINFCAELEERMRDLK